MCTPASPAGKRQCDQRDSAGDLLERVAKQVNMRYRSRGNTIIVSPDTPYVKTYRSTPEHGAGDHSTISRLGRAQRQRAGRCRRQREQAPVQVTTTSKNDFWDHVAGQQRSILNSTRLQSLSAEPRPSVLALCKAGTGTQVSNGRRRAAPDRRADAGELVISAPVSSQHQLRCCLTTWSSIGFRHGDRQLRPRSRQLVQQTSTASSTPCAPGADAGHHRRSVAVREIPGRR